MTKHSDAKSNTPRFQFRLRTVLLVMTACGIWLAFVANVIHKEARPILAVFGIAMITYAAWMVCRAKQLSQILPAETVPVTVDAKWLRRVKNPLIVGPIAALTGVSITFAPLYLLRCGQLEEFGILEWITVPLCLLTIYVVPGFYMSLASEVLRQLQEMELPRRESGSKPVT